MFDKEAINEAVDAAAVDPVLDLINSARKQIVANGNSREFSCAITKLDEAMMWYSNGKFREVAAIKDQQNA